MSNERTRASIAANINLIRAIAVPEPQPADVLKASQAGLNLLETFLQNIAEIAEQGRPELVIAEAPELSEAAIRDLFAKPAQVAQPVPEGYAQKLADELSRLCAASTEGKFFDKVTDNIATIVLALNAYNPKPEPGDGSLMSQPREGTKPFKGPVTETGQYRTPENGA